MKQKLDLTVLGCTFGLFNVMLIGTRFQIVGLGFGIFGAVLLIKALRIKK